MNNIVDPPTGADRVAQPPSDSQSRDDAAVASDSIVTYRSDPASLPKEAQAYIQTKPSGTRRFSAYIRRELKDTLSDPRALASVFMLYGIIGLSAMGGFLLGQGGLFDDFGQTSRAAIVNSTTLGVSTLGPDSPGTDADQPKPMGVADAQAQAMLMQSEITDQLGEMRAELLRLHTVFVRLVELAELDDGEFDLESPLLDWKEQSSLQKMGLLNRRIAHMSGSSGTLNSIFDVRRMAFDQKISGRPLVEGHRTSGFGYRTDPISGERLEHLGLDFSGPVGEPILALADGIVTFSGKNSGYGNLVELEHVDGLRTRYAHNQANLVSRGARVKKGEAIATLGSTGRSTGPHVHIEVRLDGTPIDPGFFVR